MSAPVVRRLLIDLETPFARHWHGGDAFRAAFTNALSMGFALGEQSGHRASCALVGAART